jgi:hypothetical protein
MLPDFLDDARAERAADIAALADMDDAQLDYLARVAELPDPLTDGLDCGDHGI